MRLRLFQVDAFTARVFRGNPAAVVPLERWPSDDLMQSIANENNLSETAFFVARGDEFDLRWFTPTQEVELCGHATLAAGYVVFRFLHPWRSQARFNTKSGPLAVMREAEELALDLPSSRLESRAVDPIYAQALGREPRELWDGRYAMAVFTKESEVRELAPNFVRVRELHGVGVIVTAPGDAVDFVSRFFAPNAGIDEDPVTGSAHCVLVPYWSARLSKKRLRARQVSKRSGELACEDRGDRVVLRGRCALYLEGSVDV
jgi:PhzF family phenazine biosynthesis protein